MAELSKTRTVLEKTGDYPSAVFFEENAYEMEEPLHFADPIGIKRETWEEFGRPEQVTVTVEPGDLLNDEEE